MRRYVDRKHRAALEALARALLQGESLDENDIREMFLHWIAMKSLPAACR